MTLEVDTSTINQAEKTLVIIDPDKDTAVISLYNEVQRLKVYAENRVIKCDEDVLHATEDLSMIATLSKTLDSKRKEYVTPVKNILAAMAVIFEKVSSPLKEADELTRKKIRDYRAEQERKRLEAEAINREKQELARREAALNDGEFTVDTTPVSVPAAPPAHVRTDVGTLGTRKVWRFEVTDQSLLPETYKLPDLVKIRKVITAGVQIPGVKGWQEEDLTIRSRGG